MELELDGQLMVVSIGISTLAFASVFAANARITYGLPYEGGLLLVFRIRGILSGLRSLICRIVCAALFITTACNNATRSMLPAHCSVCPHA